VQRALFSLFVLCLLSSAAGAGPIYWVKEIETEGGPYIAPSPFPVIVEEFGGLPSRLNAHGDSILFVANDREHGFEPWISDGTEAGAFLVYDACPGECGTTALNWTPSKEGYFFYGGPFEGGTIWRSDGTPEASTFAGDRLFFSAETPEVNRELFAVDLQGLVCAPGGSLDPAGAGTCSSNRQSKLREQPKKETP
jgi:ELWxxDGT repeat protein